MVLGKTLHNNSNFHPSTDTSTYVGDLGSKWEIMKSLYINTKERHLEKEGSHTGGRLTNHGLGCRPRNSPIPLKNWLQPTAQYNQKPKKSHAHLYRR